MTMHGRIVRIFFLFFFFSLNISLAQEARIKIEHVGYGERMEEAYFVVRNIGDVPVTDVTIYVDGVKVRTIKGGTSPGRSFGFRLYLKPGQHLIKATTPEGAEDSVLVGVSSVSTIPSTVEIEEQPLKKYKLQFILFLLILISITLYILWKERRVKL